MPARFLGALASGSTLSGVAGPSSGGFVALPLPAARIAPTINPTQPFPNLGRFRRHLNGITTDATNSPLGGVTVEWFNIGTDLSVGATVSDAAGVFDLPVYVDGTYQGLVWKAGSPNVFGASDRLPAI